MARAEYCLGMKVQMRKKHPCGSDLWTIVRLGMDIGLECCGCGHRILLPRVKFAKGIKRIIEKNDLSK